MPKIRWAAFVAAIVFALVAGVAPHQAVDHPALRQATAPGGGAGSISARPDTSGPTLTAVEPGRTVILARTDTRQASWALLTALAALALLALAAIGRRGPGLRHLLELSIRSQTEWWRPTPGGRAPPRALTS